MVNEKKVSLKRKEGLTTEYIIIYRNNHDSVYQRIDKIFNENSAYMILSMVIKAGYKDARIETKTCEHKEGITVFMPDGSAIIAEASKSEDYPGINIFLNRREKERELVCVAEYNSDKNGIFVGNYTTDSDDPIYYSKYCSGSGKENILKKYWCVTTSVNDYGRMVSAITDTIESESKPDSSSVSTKRSDIYYDWFESEEEAEEFIKTTKEAKFE